MIPSLILDMRDETFSTEAELTALIRHKLDETRQEDGPFLLQEVVITPHQEKLLKLELAERFVFRWKNLKTISLTHIANIPLAKIEPDEPLLPCDHCGRIHS